MILGASFDSEADNKKFAEKFNFNFPLIWTTTHDRTATRHPPQKGAPRVGV